MSRLLCLWLLGFVGCVSGCNNETEGDEVKTIYINHYKAECGSLALVLCLQSKGEMDDVWSYFYENIDNFEYEWGFTYKIEVELENIENPPEDSSSLKYTLLNILEKEKASSTALFDVSASRSIGLVKKISDGIYSLYGDQEFSCNTTQCVTIDSLISQELAMLFEFSHDDDSTQLILSQVKCSSSIASFRESCM